MRTYLIGWTIVCMVISILLRQSWHLFVTCDIALLKKLIVAELVYFTCTRVVAMASTSLRTIESSRHRGPILPVGSGWSFFLDKNRRKGRLVDTSHMSGQMPNGRWRAGTRIKDIQKHLRNTGKTLFSYPSIENGTLGGWIASGSHGSGGTLWKSSIGKIRVRDLQTSRTFETDANELYSKDKTLDECDGYMILDVEVLPHDDVWCNKYVFKVLHEDDCRHFFEADSYLRMLQLGRRGAMALMWVPKFCETSHVDPHFGSQTALYLQADIASIFQSSDARKTSWFHFPIEAKHKFSSLIRLSDANMFTPEPYFLWTPLGLLYKNFEFYIFVEVSSTLLWSVSQTICDAFTTRFHGRCELRCGKNLLFLDFVVHKDDCHHDVYRMVRSLFDDKSVRIRLHRGKFQFEL